MKLKQLSFHWEKNKNFNPLDKNVFLLFLRVDLFSNVFSVLMFSDNRNTFAPERGKNRA